MLAVSFDRCVRSRLLHQNVLRLIPLRIGLFVTHLNCASGGVWSESGCTMCRSGNGAIGRPISSCINPPLSCRLTQEEVLLLSALGSRTGENLQGSRWRRTRLSLSQNSIIPWLKVRNAGSSFHVRNFPVRQKIGAVLAPPVPADRLDRYSMKPRDPVRGTQHV
jgi:hypothetical protein